MSELPNAIARLRSGIVCASSGLVDREAFIELVVLAAVAGEHVLIVGPPGTAKSQAVRRISAQLGGSYFEYLLGRFTEPSELFGPVDIQQLRDGIFSIRTAGMLPEAEIVFLDEVFRGSTAILNTLLGVLNERHFRSGTQTISCPLRVCIGASNHLPEDETLAAFGDRFLVQLYVEPVADGLLEELLESGWTSQSAQIPQTSLADLDVATAAMAQVDLAGIRPLLADAIRILRGIQIVVSDRRIVRIQRLVAAAAVLGGRMRASAADLWPIVYAIVGKDEQTRAREALRDILKDTASDALRRAAEEASAGPTVRDARLREEATRWLAAVAANSDRGTMLRVEAVAREIDASFARESLSPELAQLRENLAQQIATHQLGTELQ